MPALKNLTKSLLTNIILPIVVTIVGTLGYDYIKQVPLLSSLKNVSSWMGNLLIAFFTYGIPIYLILIVGTILILAFKVYVSLRDATSNEPKFLIYKNDKLKLWKWSWDYKLSGNLYTITRVTPHCLKCDYKLKYFKDNFNKKCEAQCPNCSTEYWGNSCEDIDDIKMLIEHKIENNLFIIVN